MPRASTTRCSWGSKHFVISTLVLLISICHGDFHSHLPSRDERDIYSKRCTYDRVCDHDYGYVCREGRCTCKWGRPDILDGFKCKVQVQLGDSCREIARSGKNKHEIYIRRKCPNYSECRSFLGSYICVCRSDLFIRKGSECVPRILNTTKRCKDHLDCMVQRGQQCFKGHCVECSIGQFENYRSTAKWFTANPECVCFDKLKSKIRHETENGTTRQFNHFYKNKGECTSNNYVNYGDQCTTTRNCLSPSSTQLTCLDGICQCVPGTRPNTDFDNFPNYFPTTPQFCVSGANSPCSEDSHCHQPTSFCETRLEIPLCKCRDGFELEPLRDECNSRFYGESCHQYFLEGSHTKDLLKRQRLQCINGVYECARPREMFWSGKRGKCVSVVGGRCDLDLSDMTSCAANSRCWEYNGQGEFRCQCIQGFKASRSRRNCLKDFNVLEELTLAKKSSA